MSKESSQTRHRQRCPLDLTLRAHYPDENPPDAIEDISLALAYTGVFDGIKQQ
jgi:hypothetical protein